MQRVIITRGLPASGKSTWSSALTKQQPNFKRINRDDLRMMLYHGVWTHKREEAVLLARAVLISQFLAAGYDLVLDDTNLDPRRMQETQNIITASADELGVKVKITVRDFTDVPLEVCVARNNQRPDITRVPEKFIRDYHKKYIQV